jgi:hypothetical protein
MVYTGSPQRPQAYRIAARSQRSYVVHRHIGPLDLSDAVQRLIHPRGRPHVVFALTHPLHVGQLSGPNQPARPR